LSQNDLVDALERALLVNERYVRDRDYVIRDGRIQIVDEFTGRTADGRSWSRGVHQAIEARESLALTRTTRSGARITVQEFVGRFRDVSGMTGTAAESASEFREVYGLRVRTIAPHQPSQRVERPPVVTPSLAEKWRAVADETQRVIGEGRAVLVGTRTVDASEQLSAVFKEHNVDHVVLNARVPDREAEIIAQAGQPGRVTIATNMAGRGTDIRLADSVRDAGGLHVIITELNASPRIDRQLIGRCGRQGDPGTYRAILSSEDPILTEAFGERPFSRDPSGERANVASASHLKKAQHTIDQRQLAARRMLRLASTRRREDEEALGLDPILDILE
jgi:preprotein translocase subunit SecA